MAEAFSERRKNRRFQAQEGAFVSLGTHGPKYWQILDISMGGLSFRYMPESEDLNRARRLDILTHDTLFSLEEIPFTSVSDFEMNDDSQPNYSLRRHGVQFGELTPAKIFRLDYFIRNHTRGDV
jgi:hypothetical protein